MFLILLLIGCGLMWAGWVQIRNDLHLRDDEARFNLTSNPIAGIGHVFGGTLLAMGCTMFVMSIRLWRM